MALQLKWWHGAIVIILVFAIIVGLFLSCPNWANFPQPPPPSQDISVIPRDNLFQALTKQGVLITSGKISISKGAVITNWIGGPDLGLDSSNVCVGVDNVLANSFEMQPGVLSYKGPAKNFCNVNSIAVKVRSYCDSGCSQLEQKVRNLNIGINSLSCPQNFPHNSNTEPCCMVGFTQG